MENLPEFCPNKDCENHDSPREGTWFKHTGRYHTQVKGWVRRYICYDCNKSFSDQTFSSSYYLKKKIDLNDLMYRMSSCSGIRAAARCYHVTAKVITLRIRIIARGCIGMMSELRSDQDFTEDLTADGLESFTGSQYGPNNIHLLVGKESQYLYAADNANITRKGRMTDAQKMKRDELEKNHPRPARELESSFERICHSVDDLCLMNGRSGVNLFTDEKKEYRRVLKNNRDLDGKVNHQRTSSKVFRGFKNPLWAVNYMDREVRKDQANHVRETTRWSNNVNNCMERLYVFAAYHNFFKPYRIRTDDPRSHASVAGFDKERIKSLIKQIFTRRFFFSRLSLNISEWRLWLRAYPTPFENHYIPLPAYVTGAASHLRGVKVEPELG